MTNSSIAHTWERCVRRAKIRRRKPYQTRHTYACWMLTRNANPNWIANQMGHANAKMVLEVYGKFMPSSSASEAEKLSKQFSSCPTGAPFVKSNHL
ncbi:tyrosine-type recombinase/integrase [Enterovibrio gelatinilyticus]|uniref:tyrosine-type recombinase/integrase n=1 Tax=Enterovibrio gelatinilyticus TaxID=2899819 RepID=UPI003B671D76